MTTYRTDRYYRYDWRFSRFDVKQPSRDRTLD